MTDTRYALYFTPKADHPLSGLAANWLGYDAWSFAHVDQTACRGLSASEFDGLTNAPRKYGFHATLKAPFRLADGRDEAALLAAVKVFARNAESAEIERLQLKWIGEFLALVPENQASDLTDLAADVVLHFDLFRASLTAAELSRRLRIKLTDRQAQHLSDWGYPYVLDEFRFHMTLTDAVPEEHRQAVEEAARNHFAPILDKPLPVDRLAVFKQLGADFSFFVLQSYQLKGGVTKAAALPKVYSAVD